MAQQVTNADLVVGAVLIHGARAPKLVSRSMLADMENGTVLVDVAVIKGGCVETMRVTTHDEPTFEVDGVVHYGVTEYAQLRWRELLPLHWPTQPCLI